MLMSRGDFCILLGSKQLPNLHLEVSLSCNINFAMHIFNDSFLLYIG